MKTRTLFDVSIPAFTLGILTLFALAAGSSVGIAITWWAGLAFGLACEATGVALLRIDLD